MDYVYKSPRFLENEATIEGEKINRMGDKESARLKLEDEMFKISRVFPVLIAQGNLFSVAALFENYLVMLVETLDSNAGNSPGAEAGNGTIRLLEHIKKSHGVFAGKIPLYDQVLAAIRIRNCLVHANGVLSKCRDKAYIRKIQEDGVYLKPSLREYRKKNPPGFYEVVIVPSAFGEKIQIMNDYSVTATVYFRDYFLSLCDAAIASLVNPTGYVQ